MPPSDRGDAARALREELERFVARRPVAETPVELDPELLRRLRELGYAGEDE